MFEKLKIKYALLFIISIIVFTSCEDGPGAESKYNRSQFIGKWEQYKKKTVTKNRSTNEITDDKITLVSSPTSIELKDNGFSVIKNDPNSVCEWSLRGDQLNVGCSDFYAIHQYSPNEFILTFELTDSKTVISNFLYYRKAK